MATTAGSVTSGDASALLDEAYAHEVAAEFLDASSDSANPVVVAAYRQLELQSDRLFVSLTRRDSPTAVRVVFSRCPTPYASDTEMIRAVRATRVLEIATVAADRDRPHPLLSNVIGGAYDRFRAVHDLVGHVDRGYGFDRHGEFAAWLAQDSHYVGLARRALATELHAEHSVLWTTGVPGAAQGAGHGRERRQPRNARIAASATMTTAGTRPSFATAAQTLAARDPVLARLLALAGPPRLPRPRETPFAALVRAIVYQQLAGAAAAAIHGRLVAALNGDPTPEGLLALDATTLRSVGLSANKAASLRDLAAKAMDGTVALTPRGLARQSDGEVITRLSAVRGIGPWTAHMFLLFQLRRLDVWPTGDLGVRRGFGLAWGMPMPSARELEPLGEPFRPYRSVVAWYCWRAIELLAEPDDEPAPSP